MFGFSDPNSSNAIDLLKRDHHEVTELFEQYETAWKDGDTRSRQILAAEICNALNIHAQIEEEIFYPAIRRDVTEAKDLIDEAAVEHQSLKDIIQRLEAAPVKDPLFDAGVKVLSEYVKHHVREEENEIFPKAKSAGVDLDAIGARLAARKQELQASAGNGSGRHAAVRRSARESAKHQAGDE